MTPKEELESIESQIRALEERRRAIYQASVAAPASEKVSEDFIAEMLSEDYGGIIQYPLTISGITHGGEGVFERSGYRGREPGTWVSVRPSGPEHAGKTYLGVYLGDVATAAGASYHRDTGVLDIRVGFHNPAIWVPDLKRVVLGAESWWGVLKGPEDLVQITDKNINDTWYVKALKALTKGEEG